MPTKVRGHLHQIDLVRVLVFAAVIGVHTVSRTNGDQGQPAGAIEMGLHVTRAAFFALSGFVLMYGAKAGVRPGPTWLWRRVRLVALPYLVWTLIYWVDGLALTPMDPLPALRHLGYDIGTGAASYHLYFLLVTLQIYVAFPALLWLVRRTANRHFELLLVTLAFEAAWTGWLQYVWQPGHVLGGLIGHADTLLPSYLFWVIGGMVAAVHRRSVDAWVGTHGAQITAAAVVLLGAAETTYGLSVLGGYTPLHASAVLQPVMLLWSTAAILLIYAIGLKWAAAPSRVLGPQIATASLASFGVFLVHPLVLQLLTQHGLSPDDKVLQSPVATLVAYVLTIIGSCVLVAIFLHSPFATMLTGRPRLPRREGPVGDRGLSRARIAGVLAMVVFAASVVTLDRANAAQHRAQNAADEFTAVNSLVTSPAGTSAGATASPSPGAPVVTAPTPPIQTTLNIVSGGMTRHYLLIEPAARPADLPMLLFLHGVTASPTEESVRDGFLPLAETGQAVLVYPAGYGETWDAGGATGQAAIASELHLDDVSFVKAVIAQVKAQERTDPRRTYVAGFSNGAKLIWSIACQQPAGITAFAEFGGNPDTCADRAQVPYFIGVGGKDGTEPIAGKATDDRGAHPALKPELTRILARNGCTSKPVVTSVSTETSTAWTCTKGEVDYTDWLTADHHWPRPPVVTPAGSAATLVWSFFSSKKG